MAVAQERENEVALPELEVGLVVDGEVGQDHAQRVDIIIKVFFVQGENDFLADIGEKLGDFIL